MAKWIVTSNQTLRKVFLRTEAVWFSIDDARTLSEQLLAAVTELEVTPYNRATNISDLLELIEDLAGSLRDFGATQNERRSSMSRRAAEALDLADTVLRRVDI